MSRRNHPCDGSRWHATCSPAVWPKYPADVTKHVPLGSSCSPASDHRASDDGRVGIHLGRCRRCHPLRRDPTGSYHPDHCTGAVTAWRQLVHRLPVRDQPVRRGAGSGSILPQSELRAFPRDRRRLFHPQLPGCPAQHPALDLGASRAFRYQGYRNQALGRRRLGDGRLESGTAGPYSGLQLVSLWLSILSPNAIAA